MKQKSNLIKYILNCTLIVAIAFTLSIFTSTVLAEWTEPDCTDPDVCNVLQILSSNPQTQFKYGKLTLADSEAQPEIFPNENDQLSVYADSADSAIYVQQDGSGYALYASGKVGIGDANGEICLADDCITEWPSGGLWELTGTDVYYDAGNVGIGLASPNSLLHIYDTGANAELDIQSVAGANQHWAIYHDRDTEDLKFWNNDGDNVLTLTNEGLVRVRNFATGDLPTCDSNVLGSIVFDTDEDAHYSCASGGWTALGSGGGGGLDPDADAQAAIINEMSAADGASALEAMTASEAAAVVNSDNLETANAAAIFNHSNLSISKASDILDNSNLWASKASSVVAHANFGADRSQTVMRGMSSLARVVDIITSGAPDTTYSSNDTITDINRFGTLTIESGVTLNVDSQPGVIIASSLINNGTVHKTYTGTSGGATASSTGDGGDGGGGLVILSKSLDNNSIIEANGEKGENGSSTGSNGSGSNADGDSTIIRIGSDTVGDGGDGGKKFESNLGSVGYFGAGGGGYGATYKGGNGGGISYVTYNTAADLYDEQRKATIDWWLVSVVGKSLTVTESFVDAQGAGGGGGADYNRRSDCGGGGAGGGSIVLLTDVFDNNGGTIQANGGNGGIRGNEQAYDAGGGGGGGGILYGLYRTTLTSEGTISVSGGTGASSDENCETNGIAGTAGVATIYDASGF